MHDVTKESVPVILCWDGEGNYSRLDIQKFKFIFEWRCSKVWFLYSPFSFALFFRISFVLPLTFWSLVNKVRSVSRSPCRNYLDSITYERSICKYLFLPICGSILCSLFVDFILEILLCGFLSILMIFRRFSAIFLRYRFIIFVDF